ncbi:flagellar motor switch protein FliN [bacterium]|nr:flagellar motor switch protein FliN [bacterium]
MNEQQGPRSVQFGALDGSAQPSGAASSIDLLRDVPVEVKAELGKADRLVRDVLRLTVGTVIDLDKEAGAPVDLIVNNHMIARGEVVEIDGRYGVRVTEIIR